jgi:hypothetical protein
MVSSTGFNTRHSWIDFCKGAAGKLRNSRYGASIHLSDVLLARLESRVNGCARTAKHREHIV